MNTNARVTIGVLSKHTGVNIETIRYYERIGIVPSLLVALADTGSTRTNIDKA